MTTNNLMIINSICNAVYRILFLIKKNHPNWLKEKFRDYPWQDLNFQNNFKHKLKTKLEVVENKDELVNKVIDLFYQIVYPSFFTSVYFEEFIDNLKKNNYLNNHFDTYHFANSNQNISFALAILLLDTENLYIDINSEKILARVCIYPIKLKFAFGNWRSLGKKDVEFYERGYELFHVPPGKNSADLKMISFGSSIWLNYPNAKEVLICSSDGDLNHLSTTLQHHGITVYKVSRRSDELIVVNSQTTQIKTFCLAQIPEFPSFEDCLDELKLMIRTEQQRTEKNWIKLARLQQMFKKKFQLNLQEIIEYHYPDKTLEEVLLNSEQKIVVYKENADNHLYLTLFSEQSEQKAAIKDLLTLDTPANLEGALLQIIQQLTPESEQKYVAMSQVASEFQKKYKLSITQVMEKLQLGKKFAKLIQSYDSLKVKKEANVYYIALV
ncbi:NYN domain-containing protein [Gloeocapsa sp. PCC 73106]|uniref:NYN domain-containing protein n=1 Tax=Gloeocapsa sp. PCC 73106 TaxID=102232 RepID=UPI0002AC4855|nr:NYN domain-containing protein [Gloeocapsa sp. PCC 73106]ELR98151.1 Protein of unknown function DUF88 [Gloeocapsa sp. PCC 73106]